VKASLGLAAALAWALFAAPALASSERVVVGSKAFPESWILAESATLLAQSVGAKAEHSRNLGGTEITYAALVGGQIDLYPEYTGTLAEVILHHPRLKDLDALRVALAPLGLAISEPLGFNDGYALAASAAAADRYGLRSLSDLARWPDLRVGITHELLGRSDGYPGLSARYGLRFSDLRGVQHELALDAAGRGDLDVVDVYTTDAQIDRMKLRVLDDDRHFFPRYDAVFLYRADLPSRAPVAMAAVLRLVGRVDDATMRRANARVVLDHRPVDDAARALVREALAEVDGGQSPVTRDAAASTERDAAASTARDIARNAARHLGLVALSLAAAMVIGVPLGIASSRSRPLSAIAGTLANVVQTIPSLALLALLIPLLGIGTKPAVAALFLYGLLPIVRGTESGLTTIPAAITESAEAIGLPLRARLTRVLLPLASPHIVAGVRTSAVIAVGTATIAALVGAGGLGDPILQGIALHDGALVAQGAVPAALLALAIDGAFVLLARLLVPRGLRLSTRSRGGS
jgi:osmoprotectant transport system permease protein